MDNGSSPFLSILIPTWNRAEHALRAIATVNPPTADVEIVVVDDGSDPAVFRRLAEGTKDMPAVRLFRNDHNLGMVKNWNQCIAHAQGEWMGLLCDDDVYLPGAIARLYALLKTLSAPSLVLPNTTRQGEVDVWPAGAETARSLGLPNASGNFWHRDAVTVLGGFDEHIKYSADAEYWYRIARYFPVVKVSQPFAQYLRHDKSYMWTTWRQPDFMQQIELLGRITLKYCMSEAEYEVKVEQEVEAGLWDTVVHIMASSFLRPGKQDIFIHYLPEALRRAHTWQRRKALLAALAQITLLRIDAGRRRASANIRIVLDRRS